MVQSVGKPAVVHNRVEADIPIVCGRVAEHHPRHHLLVSYIGWVRIFPLLDLLALLQLQEKSSVIHCCQSTGLALVDQLPWKWLSLLDVSWCQLEVAAY